MKQIFRGDMKMSSIVSGYPVNRIINILMHWIFCNSNRLLPLKTNMNPRVKILTALVHVVLIDFATQIQRSKYFTKTIHVPTAV